MGREGNMARSLSELFTFFLCRWLYSNQITSLPVEMGRLKSLKKLWLDHNLIEDLPAELSALANLQDLYIDHNRINTLPVELTDLLNQLRHLEVEGNPGGESLRPPPSPEPSAANCGTVRPHQEAASDGKLAFMAAAASWK